jgi:hypothetical protein
MSMRPDKEFRGPLLWECMGRHTLTMPAKRTNGAARNGNGANGNGSKPTRPASKSNGASTATAKKPQPHRFVRVAGDTRCCGRRKDGGRCRGRARPGTDFCFFHDPAISSTQRREIAAKGGKSRRRRKTLPKGYPRQLNSPRTIQKALDRLYSEVRTGVLDAETGRTLLEVIERLTQTVDLGGNGKAMAITDRVAAIANVIEQSPQPEVVEAATVAPPTVGRSSAR